MHTYLLLSISMLWHTQAIFESKGDKFSTSAEGRIRTQRVSDTWMPADKPTELSRIKLKTWTRQPVPMISEHLAHLTPLSVDFRTWLWWYTCLLLLISMLWHRQAIFESKGDKLSSSAEGRIRTQRVSDTYSPADWMPADKPTELSRIKLKTWTRQPVPMNSEHSAHLTPLPFGIRTWLWRYTYLLLSISMLWHRQAIFESKGDKLSSFIHTYIHTYIHIYIHTYIFVVVNFDALAQASDFRIERRQVVFLCRMQDSNPGGLWNLIFSRLNACWQTDWAIDDQAKNLNSTAHPHDQQAFSPPDSTAICHSHLALAIYIFVVVNFDALAQASDFRIERRQVVFLCRMQDSNPGGLWNLIFSRLNACWQTDWAIEDQAKNLNSTAHPHDQQAFSPPDPTAIWHSHLALAIYIFVVVNFDALAQASDFRIERRQVVFLCRMQDSNPGGLWNHIHTYIHTYIHTCLLLLISMLWHRQAIFKSKGDKLCSSAESRIWTRDPRHQFASRLNARWQTDWAIKDQAKNLNSTARPYDQRAFSPLGPTVSWLSHLALAIYMFVVVNFDALAQASDIQIERRQVVFLCWKQDLNPGPQTPNYQQTECSLTNRLSYQGSS